MDLRNELERVVGIYKGEIDYIGEFVTYSEKSLSRKQDKKIRNQLNDIQLNELVIFQNELGKAIEAEGGVINLNLSDEVSNFIRQTFTPIKHKTFLAEMSLSYLVSHQEAFLKDYIFQILTHRKSLLRSGATMTFLEISEHSSMKSIMESIAQQEVDNLGRGSIDDVADYFKKKLNIEIKEFSQWEKFREACFRRNIIIHNKGITNKIYCKKTGYKRTNNRLETSNEYVSDAIKNVKEFIDFFHIKIIQKLKL